MRHATVLAFLVLLVLTLGACGGKDSGSGNEAGIPPGGFPELAPSSDVPALVDTAGMTEAELEAKLEEIEKIHEAKMDEMLALSSVSKDRVKGQKLLQATADMKALSAQIMIYDAAIDALDR